MKVNEMSELLNLEILTTCKIDQEIEGVYIGDLLSVVMSHANKGDVWLTVQTHVNIIAVASLLECSAIIIVEGGQIDDDALLKANQEAIVVCRTELPAYELAKQLATML